MQEIQFKYKNNPELMNKEIMDLYKREKLNPFSGCLSSILQIIIILSVFWLVSKPLTYMNNSGEAVKNVINYYNIDINDILVIYDDMDFDVGKFKIKASGSSGGHNGIKSIIKYLGTEDFKRIRIGISKSSYDVVDYVLGKFSKEDMNKLKEVFNTINDVIDDFVSLPFEKLMSKYN